MRFDLKTKAILSFVQLCVKAGVVLIVLFWIFSGHLPIFKLHKAEAASITVTISDYTTGISDATYPPPTAAGTFTAFDGFNMKGSASVTVTGVVVTLNNANSLPGISSVDIYEVASNSIKCTVTSPASVTLSFTNCGMSLTTSDKAYLVRVYPKTHPNMPAPPGGTYAVSGTVTSWTGGSKASGTDTTSATITYDNLSPGDVTNALASAGNTQASLSWTNPSDSDFSQVVVLRKAGSSITDAPAEAANYVAGSTIGASTVRYAGSGTTFTDTGLTNGTTYYYKFFTKDTSGNYSASSTAVELTVAPFVYTISGTVYSDEGSTAITQAMTVYMSINGMATTSTSTVNGLFTFFTSTPSGGVPIVIYTASSTAPGALVTLASTTGTNLSGMNIYKNRLILRYENTGPLTNANIGTFDKDNDSRYLFFTSNTNNLTLDSGFELHVWAGKTYTPGGTITINATLTGGDLHLATSSTATLDTSGNTIGRNIIVGDSAATLNINATSTINGGISVSGSGKVTYTSGTPAVTFGGTGTLSSGSNALDFFNLTVSGTGNITDTAATTTIAGNLTNSGTFTASSGTVVIGSTPPVLGANWETFGSSGIGTGQFSSPSSIAIDNTNKKVYVTDNTVDKVMRFDSGSGGTTFGGNWETFGSTGTGSGQFDMPTGVVVEPASNKVYLADYNNSRIARFDSGSGGTTFGGSWETFGSAGTGSGQFRAPSDVALDSVNNKIYVADFTNSRLVRFDSGSGGTTFGGSWETFGTSGSGTGQFGSIYRITVDSVNNKVYVVDFSYTRIDRFDSGGGGTTLGANWETFGTSGSGAGQFSNMEGLTVDHVNHKLYVADYGNNRIVIVDSGAEGTTFGGNWETFGTSGSGVSQFSNPNDTTLDVGNKKTYVIDGGNDRIARFDSGVGSGGSSTISGSVTLNHLIATGGTITQAGALDVNGSLTISSGATLNASSSYAFSVAGFWTNSGTFVPNSGTVTFDGAITAAISAGTGGFANLVFNNASGQWTISDSSLTLTGNLTMTAGTLFGSGNLTVQGGSVTGNGTILFTGGSTGQVSDVDSTGTYIYNVKQISSGYYQTCAVTSSDNLYCWGDDSYGQVGNGAATGDQLTPNRVLKGTDTASADIVDTNYLGNVAYVSTAFRITCASTLSGNAYCWGDDSYGQLGNGATTGVQTIPNRVLKGTDTASADIVDTNYLGSVAGISVADYSVCVSTLSGNAYCWGNGTNGKLGNGGTANQTIPNRVLKGADTASADIVDTNYLGSVVNISAGTNNACANTQSGNLYCWGWDNYGAVGNGAVTGDQSTPNRVLKGAGGDTAAGDTDGANLTNIASVSVGYNAACAVSNSGNAYCWGYDINSKLGNGDSVTANQTTPDRVLKGTDTAISDTDGTYLTNIGQITDGYYNTCAVSNNGNAYCWGSDLNGEAGNGDVTGNQGAPNRVLKGTDTDSADIVDTNYLGNATYISAGTNSTCASTNSGNAYCWGYNSNGQVGNGSYGITDNRLVPNRVLKGEAVAGSGNDGSAFLVDGTGSFGGNSNWVFGDLIFGDGSGAATIISIGSGSITASSTSVSLNQILNAGPKTFYLDGATSTPLSVSGSLIASTSIFSFLQTTGTTTIPSQTFYNLSLAAAGGTPIFNVSSNSLTINNNFSISTSSSFTASATTTIGGNLTINGTFNHNNGTVVFNGSATSTITSAASTTFGSIYVATAGKAVAFQKYNNNNLFTIAGTLKAVGSSAPNGLVSIVSDTPGQQWLGHFNSDQVAGNITYAYIKDSGCDDTSANVDISDGTSTDGHNNSACWMFVITGISISGSSNLPSGTVWMAVGSNLQSGKTGSISSGTWNISNVSVSSGNIVTVWVHGAADSDESTAVTKYDGAGNITNMVLNRNVLTLGSSDTAVSLTNANLGLYDCRQDEDIMHSASGSPAALLLTGCTNSYTNPTLSIASSTLAPGGDVTAVNLSIASTSTYTGGAETLTLTGTGTPLTIAGTFSAATGTISFIPSTTTGVSIPTLNYYNLTLNKSGNTFTAATGTLAVLGNLNVAAGILDLSVNNSTSTISGNLTIAGTLKLSSTTLLTVLGNFTNNGTFTHNNGTVIVGSTTPVTIGGSSATNFYNLTATGTGATIQFKAGSTFGIAGTLSATGIYGLPLLIQSDTPGSQWIINLTGTANLNYVRLTDAGCSVSSRYVSLGEYVYTGGNNGWCWGFIIRGGGGGSSHAAQAIEGDDGGGTSRSGGGQGGNNTPIDGGSQDGGGTPETGGGQGGGGGASPP